MTTAEPLFDDYLIVDWSAESRPKTGADSIWIGSVERDHGGRVIGHAPVNPPTRAAATALLIDRLADLADRGRAVFVGFDFAFGYPAGFASRLDPHRPDWRGVWAALGSRIEDGGDNANNRFAVAADLNRMLSRAPFPFWGCPAAQAGPWLQPTRPGGYAKDRRPGAGVPALAERRACDRAGKGPQPVWKLAYPGSVGSQSLLGIARLRDLCADPRLAHRLRVWPFETGLAALDRGAQEPGGSIIVAEVYPSILPATTTATLPKDAVQVSGLARHFADCDTAGTLAPAFAGPPGLDPAERAAAEAEEGWILGIGWNEARAAMPGNRP